MKPRVLWVTPEVPDRAGGGGAIRQAELLVRLRDAFQIDLLVAGRLRDASVRDAVGEVIEVDARPADPPGRRRALAALALHRRPMHTTASAAARDALGAELEARVGGYDAVVLHHEELLPLLDRCGPALRVLHVFDVKALRATQTAAVARSRRSALVWQAEASAARRLAGRWLGEADLVVACTAEDLDALLAMVSAERGPQGVVAPNGVDLARFAPTPAPGRLRVVFLGSLDYEPNVDGITWFANEVWPAVRAAVPDATLTIAGHRPTSAVLALGAILGVDVVGAVADASACYAEHDVAVVPLRIGTGSRLKALEAMASGRPTIGTPVGLEGLDLEAHPGAAIVADGPTGLAAALIDVLQHGERARALGEAGRAHVEERFGWGTAAEAFADPIARRLADRVASTVEGVSVLVCTCGRDELLRSALASIDGALGPRDELLVVEAGGSHAAEAVAALGSAARHLGAPRPGKSRQLNQGLRAATRPVVVMTDDDCRVEPGWVAAMAAPFVDPAVGAVFGEVLGLSGVRDATVPPLAPGLPPAVTWEYANGAAMAVRREAALAIGGYDERLGPGASVHGEEHDLVLRLQDAGWLVRIADAPPVQHMDWRDADATRANLLTYSRGAGAFVGLAVRRSPRRGARLLVRRARYQATLWRHAPTEGRAFGPATTWAFARGLAKGLRLRPMSKRQLP
jgi:glycosyltransferase involved in cell wall biosynthesis